MQAGLRLQSCLMSISSVSTSEAARRLKLSAERVRQLARSGALPSVRTELGRLFDPDDLDRFAAERAKRGTTTG